MLKVWLRIVYFKSSFVDANIELVWIVLHFTLINENIKATVRSENKQNRQFYLCNCRSKFEKSKRNDFNRHLSRLSKKLRSFSTRLSQKYLEFMFSLFSWFSKRKINQMKIFSTFWFWQNFQRHLTQTLRFIYSPAINRLNRHSFMGRKNSVKNRNLFVLSLYAVHCLLDFIAKIRIRRK